MTENKKLQVGIFDLTDCEGCELQFLSRQIEIDKILENVDLVEARLLTDNLSNQRLDIALIEGTLLTKQDIELLYKVRNRSDKVIAFGTCAVTGGIASGLSQQERVAYAKIIYGKNYKIKVGQALPIANYIKVDLILPGCPADPLMVARSLDKLMSNGWPVAKNYPICQECKANGNKCLLTDNKPCLGPITAAGCGSACPNSGFACLGCLGLWDEANLDQFLQALKKLKLPKERIKQLLSFYLKNDELIQKALRRFDG